MQCWQCKCKSSAVLCLRTNMVQMWFKCIASVQAYDQLSAEESEKGGKYCGTLANPALLLNFLFWSFSSWCNFFTRSSWSPGGLEHRLLGMVQIVFLKKGFLGLLFFSVIICSGWSEVLCLRVDNCPILG